MKKYNLKDMTNGWFIGNFSPSLYKADYEVAIKKYKKGDREQRHYHKISKEFTVILSGKVEMNGKIYVDDDIIFIDQNESTDFICIEDTVTVVVKTSSEKNDKYLI